jgi:hypothetical protein
MVCNLCFAWFFFRLVGECPVGVCHHKINYKRQTSGLVHGDKMIYMHRRSQIRQSQLRWLIVAFVYASLSY